MSDATAEKTEEYEVVQTYEGSETTIYYDNEGQQHVTVNDNEPTSK